MSKCGAQHSQVPQPQVSWGTWLGTQGQYQALAAIWSRNTWQVLPGRQHLLLRLSGSGPGCRDFGIASNRRKKREKFQSAQPSASGLQSSPSISDISCESGISGEIWPRMVFCKLLFSFNSWFCFTSYSSLSFPVKVDTTCVFQLPLLNIQFPNESWDLSEELVDRLEGLAVTLLGELEIVPHVVVRDALVNLGWMTMIKSWHLNNKRKVATWTNPVSMLTSWSRLFPFASSPNNKFTWKHQPHLNIHFIHEEGLPPATESRRLQNRPLRFAPGVDLEAGLVEVMSVAKKIDPAEIEI